MALLTVRVKINEVSQYEAGEGVSGGIVSCQWLHYGAVASVTGYGHCNGLLYRNRYQYVLIVRR